MRLMSFQIEVFVFNSSLQDSNKLFVFFISQMMLSTLSLLTSYLNLDLFLTS